MTIGFQSTPQVEPHPNMCGKPYQVPDSREGMVTAICNKKKGHWNPCGWTDPHPGMYK